MYGDNVWAVDVKVILSEKSSATDLQEAITINHHNIASSYYFSDFKTYKEFIYNPGQYISVKVAEDRFNAYSIVKNNRKNTFSLLVDIKPSGPGSKYFENLKVNDKISFLGPFGNFTLNTEDGAKKLIFLAGLFLSIGFYLSK